MSDWVYRRPTQYRPRTRQLIGPVAAVVVKDDPEPWDEDAENAQATAAAAVVSAAATGAQVAVAMAADSEVLPYEPVDTAAATAAGTSVVAGTLDVNGASALFDTDHVEMVAWQIPPPSDPSLAAIVAVEQSEAQPHGLVELSAAAAGSSVASAALDVVGTNFDVQDEVAATVPLLSDPTLESVAAENNPEIPHSLVPLSGTVVGSSVAAASLDANGTNFDVSHETAVAEAIQPERDATVAILQAQQDSEVIPVSGPVAPATEALPEDDSALIAELLAPDLSTFAAEQATFDEIPVNPVDLGAATAAGSSVVAASLDTAGTNFDVSHETATAETIAPERDAGFAIQAAADAEVIPGTGAVPPAANDPPPGPDDNQDVAHLALDTRAAYAIAIEAAEITVQPSAVQVARPDSTTSAGGWTPENGPTLHEVTSDQDDGTWAQLTDAQQSTMELGLETLQQPQPGDGRVRIRKERE